MEMDSIENAYLNRRNVAATDPNVAILNYYTCNVDTLWVWGAVMILMVGTLLLLKIIVWDSIYRHHGICYPMGAILGGGASRCVDSRPAALPAEGKEGAREDEPTESFVSKTPTTPPTPTTAQDAYPELVPTVVNYVEQTGSNVGRTLKSAVQRTVARVIEGWRWGDRRILDLHGQVGHLRGMVYDDYVRPVVQKYMRS